MIKKPINQNHSFDLELLKSIGYNYIFNNEPINRSKNKINNTEKSEEDKITNPLLALYRRPVLKLASKLLAEGKRRPLLLWEGWRMASLSAPEETPWICRDANTPEEYQEAQAYFQTKNND